MSAEILTFIQAQSGNQAQNLQQVSSQQESSQPGLFDSIITSLTGQTEEIRENLTNPETEGQAQNFTFSGNKSLSQSVIDILSDLSGDENNSEVINAEAEALNEFADTIFDGDKFFRKITTFLNDEVKFKDDAMTDVFKDFISDKVEVIKENYNIENIISQILNDEELSEKFEVLTEETKQEVLKVIDEISDTLKNFDNSEIKAKISDLIDNITANLKTPKVFASKVDDDEETETDDDTPNFDDEAKISNENINMSGLAGVIFRTANDNENVQAPSEKPEVSNSPAKSQVITHPQAHNVQNEAPVKAANENETVKPEVNFSEVLDTTEAEHENSNQNNNFAGNQQEDNKSGNFTQSRENFTSSRTSRARNDNRKVDTQNDNDKFSSSTQKTQSHSTFQNFFEGVLSNRRTASRTSPFPLNLNDSANFTQSMTLRDGLVNVVRFIRADGVHKANVVIDPPALGRISVELTSGSSGVEASIKVASEQIRNLIQDQLDQLRMNLSQQGVQVAEFTVDVQQDNSGSQQQNSQQGNQERNFFTIADDEEPEEFRVDLEEGLLYWVA